MCFSNLGPGSLTGTSCRLKLPSSYLQISQGAETLKDLLRQGGEAVFIQVPLGRRTRRAAQRRRVGDENLLPALQGVLREMICRPRYSDSLRILWQNPAVFGAAGWL